MCMIAVRPHDGGGNIPNAVIDTALTRHPDGFGLMYRDATGLHTQSWAPSGRKAFRKALKAADRSGVEYAAHFRWATSGPKNAEMAHPYTYEDPDPEVGTVAVMHNGVIDIAHNKATESDTSAFVRLVLAQLPSRWWAQPALTYLVGEAIGYSKLTIMTATETWVSHEKRGEWDGGLWYSSDHRPRNQSWSGKGTTYTPQVARMYNGHYVYNNGGKDGYWDNATNSFVAVPEGWKPDAPKAPTQKPIASKAPASKSGVKAVTKAVVPYTGTAAKSAAALGLLDSPERIVDKPHGFRHAGHNLTAVRDIRLDAGDADYEDAVICDTCRTIGTVYVIDGDYYIDMAHVVGADEDEDTFLPARPYAV